MFRGLIISLFKESKNKSDKRPRLAYTNDSSGDSDSSWENLINSRYHFENKAHFNKIFSPQNLTVKSKAHEGISLLLKTCPSTFTRYVFLIVRSLHLLYEDMKLDMFYKPFMGDLAGLVHAIGRLIGRYGTQVCEYYKNENKETVEKENAENIEKYLEENVEIEDVQVLNIYTWLSSILQGQNLFSFPILLEKTRKICRIFSCLTNSSDILTTDFFTNSKDDISLDSDLTLSETYPVLTYGLKVIKNDKVSLNVETQLEKVIEVLVNEHFTDQELQTLPPAFSIPIYEIIRKIQLNPPSSANY